MSNIDYIVIGLGNPGAKYERTWHNLGFMCLDILAKRHHFRCDKIRFKGLVADVNLGSSRVLFLKPQTFMNKSGESVREVMSFYKLPPECCIIVYDDFELPLGHLRIRKQGSAGSHNGMRSILYHVESDKMPRIRVGFGPKPEYFEVKDYVLSRISDKDLMMCGEALEVAADAVELMVRGDIDNAMNKFNGKVISER